MPPSRFRDDIHVIGVPLTEICQRAYTDPRQRQLFKNIIYVGALSALLGIEPEVVETLFGEQYKGKEKLLDSNVEALHLGLRPRAARTSTSRSACKVRARRPRRRPIFIEGNAAAALGCVYGGATVCAWYPITPSLLGGRGVPEVLQRSCASTRTTGKNTLRDRAGRGRDRLDRHGRSAPAGTARAPSPRPRARAFR